MMAKEIGSLQRASIWWLIVLFGAGLLHVARCQERQPECMTKLFVELNDGDLTHAQAEKRLRTVDIEDRDTAVIGTVSVAQLLNLKDKPCKLEDLTGRDAPLSESDFACEGQVNKGAKTFFNHYEPKWRESCAKAMKSLWKETFEMFPAREKEILQNICPDKRRGFLDKIFGVPDSDTVCLQREKARALIIYPESDTVRQDLVPACGRLIIELSKFMSSDGMKLLNRKYEFLNRWFSTESVCQYYLEYLCRIFGAELTDKERETCTSIQEYILFGVKAEPLDYIK